MAFRLIWNDVYSGSYGEPKEYALLAVKGGAISMDYVELSAETVSCCLDELDAEERVSTATRSGPKSQLDAHLYNHFMDAIATTEVIATEPPCKMDGCLAIAPVPLLDEHSCGSDGYRFREPILTIGGAAQMLGVSQKRLANIIAEEKARIGRPPDFVCDAGGKMRMRILRDELLEWMRAKRKKCGRPSKRMPQ